MIGALAYFIGTADSRPAYLLVIGKAVVWPALLVYRAFRILGEQGPVSLTSLHDGRHGRMFAIVRNGGR